MEKELFNQIVSKKYSFNQIDESNYLGNKEVYQCRFASKDSKEPYYRWLVEGLNYKGNSVYTNEEGDRNLAALYHYGIFTEEQWNDLIPQIFYRDFNKDFDELVNKVVPLFKPIKKFYNDLHLEFWQGIFSFGTHWAVANKELKNQINSKRNGKLYCDTLLSIYPYFKEFLDKWPNEQYTLFRFAKAVGPNTYRGILYEEHF